MDNCISVSGQSQVRCRSYSSQSQVSLCAYFVRQTEPEILRLVLVNVGHICSLFSSRVTTLAFLGQLPCLSFPLACSCVHTPDICLPKKFSQLFSVFFQYPLHKTNQIWLLGQLLKSNWSRSDCASLSPLCGTFRIFVFVSESVRQLCQTVDKYSRFLLT